MKPLNKIKIFLVDDNVLFIETLKSLLSEERVEIKSFITGEECINCLNEEPEIIILDYLLDDKLNGVQILNKIKHLRPETNVIILSGIDKENIIEDSMKYGAYDFIWKGDDGVFKLHEEIEYLCEEIESSRELKKSNKRMLWANAIIILIVVSVVIFNWVK